VYVTLTVRDNCAHSHLILDHSTFFFASRAFLRDTFYAVLLEEMEIVSREEKLFDCVTAYF